MPWLLCLSGRIRAKKREAGMSDDQEWIELMAKHYGRQTINETRAEAGLPPVEGGDIAHVDWLKRMAGIPLRPSLKLVPT